MTEQQEAPFTARIMIRPLGSKVRSKTLNLGAEPCVLIEPVESEQGVIFSLDSTGLDKDNLILVLEAMAQTLKETELKQIEEG